MKSPSIAVVVIGRNEGERLRQCLASILVQCRDIVYVDSGSKDGSAAYARSLGIKVVELDARTPFSAARARNEGAFFLKDSKSPPEFIQFIDGDCQLQPGWIGTAVEHLQVHKNLGIVTGWLSEVEPSRSIYNAMCDFEWHGPTGLVKACCGRMMVRSAVFYMIDGFKANVVAAEDDEFCIRVRRSGHGIERLPVEMASHDAAMTRFSEWWRRAVRTGHGFAQVGAMHSDYFKKERLRVIFFAVLLPVIALFAVVLLGFDKTTLGASALAMVFLLYCLSFYRSVKGLARAGLPTYQALHQGFYLLISKFPNALGMWEYYKKSLLKRSFKIIEYK